MKLKKKMVTIAVGAATVLLLSTTAISASDQISSYLFKGKLIINNQLVSLKQDMFNINGSVYVPVRALTEQLQGEVSYDSSDQTIYIEHQVPTSKKSTVHAKQSDERFTLHAFSSKAEVAYGDPIEIWSRITNDTEQSLNISHGSTLIKYDITDADGFTSHLIEGLELAYSSFEAGDELNTSLSHRDFLVYNINKLGLDNAEDMQQYVNKADRPYILPRGEYTITVKAEYTVEGDSQVHLLETSIPLHVK